MIQFLEIWKMETIVFEVVIIIFSYIFSVRDMVWQWFIVEMLFVGTSFWKFGKWKRLDSVRGGCECARVGIDWTRWYEVMKVFSTVFLPEFSYICVGDGRGRDDIRFWKFLPWHDNIFECADLCWEIIGTKWYICGNLFIFLKKIRKDYELNLLSCFPSSIKSSFSISFIY